MLRKLLCGRLASPVARDVPPGAVVAGNPARAKFGRYGYRRISGLLRMAGWQVNAKHVQRIWRPEGISMQPARTRSRKPPPQCATAHLAAHSYSQ